MERNTLMAQVYPKLKDYCREKHGLEFQVSYEYYCQHKSPSAKSEDLHNNSTLRQVVSSDEILLTKLMFTACSPVHAKCPAYLTLAISSVRDSYKTKGIVGI
jgi:hypothetical protein